MLKVSLEKQFYSFLEKKRVRDREPRKGNEKQGTEEKNRERCEEKGGREEEADGNKWAVQKQFCQQP